MSTDILLWLRDRADTDDPPSRFTIAADEIERLRAALTGRTVSCGACEAMAKELAEAVALLHPLPKRMSEWEQWGKRRDALLARHKEGA